MKLFIDFAEMKLSKFRIMEETTISVHEHSFNRNAIEGNLEVKPASRRNKKKERKQIRFRVENYLPMKKRLKWRRRRFDESKLEFDWVEVIVEFKLKSGNLIEHSKGRF